MSKRQYRRATLFDGGSVTVRFSRDMLENLERESERENVSVPHLVRACVQKHLPTLKATSRKRRVNSRVKEGVKGASQ